MSKIDKVEAFIVLANYCDNNENYKILHDAVLKSISQDVDNGYSKFVQLTDEEKCILTKNKSSKINFID